MSIAVDSSEIEAPAGAPGALPDLQRVLRIRVPVIVQIARRRLPVAQIRKLSVGMIIEFDRLIDTPLDLLVNNRKIGAGAAVRINENFGLRVAQICTPAERVTKLGA